MVINGAAPRTIGTGSVTPEGVKLIAVDSTVATLEFDGRRHRLAVGEHAVAAATANSSPSSTTLLADQRGHFFATGIVNGAPVRFMVDTGATLVALGAGDAARAGVDYRRGQPMVVMTANGAVQAWRVKLSSLQLGNITLRDVDAAIQGEDTPIALLGMSFLNFLEMKRDGETMTLRRRF